MSQYEDLDYDTATGMRKPPRWQPAMFAMRPAGRPVHPGARLPAINPRELGDGEWVCADGRVCRLSEMGNKHLQNAANQLLRAIREAENNPDRYVPLEAYDLMGYGGIDLCPLDRKIEAWGRLLGKVQGELARRAEAGVHIQESMPFAVLKGGKNG